MEGGGGSGSLGRRKSVGGLRGGMGIVSGRGGQYGWCSGVRGGGRKGREGSPGEGDMGGGPRLRERNGRSLVDDEQLRL